MTKQELQFSLRGLLLFMALLAIVIAFAANQPRIASVCLVLAGPFLVTRAMPFVFRCAPRHARWIMAILGSVYSFTCALLCLRGLQATEFDWRMWLALAVLTAFSTLCLCISWVDHHKVKKNINPSTSELVE
jgi:hypothetical protein